MTGRYLLLLQLKKYSWSEVQTHTDPKDKWLVIEGQVYNITNWARRHPGGSRVISHYAGQDATVSIWDACCPQCWMGLSYRTTLVCGTWAADLKCLKLIQESCSASWVLWLYLSDGTRWLNHVAIRWTSHSFWGVLKAPEQWNLNG